LPLHAEGVTEQSPGSRRQPRTLGIERDFTNCNPERVADDSPPTIGNPFGVHGRIGTE
jgi:hypothetical protein